MVLRSKDRVNPLLLLTLTLGACTAPPSPRTPTLDRSFPLGMSRAVLDASPPSENGLADMIARGHLAIPEPFDWNATPERAPAPPPGPDDLDLSALGPRLERAEPDDSLGEALKDYLREHDAVAARVDALGFGGLTLDEQFGSNDQEALCEEPAVVVDAGDGYEASYSLGVMGHFLSPPEIVWETLGSGCADDLLANAGDVDAAGECDEFEVATFFPEGSACRTCVEGNGGDFSACVDAGECLAKAPSQSWVAENGGEREWFTLTTAVVFGCAPDYAGQMYVMVRTKEDGSLPDPWDHEGWAHFCPPYYDGGLTYGCTSGSQGWRLGHTTGAGAVGRVNWIRQDEDEGEPYRDRLWYASSVELFDYEITSFWATTPGAGQISEPRSGIQAGAPDPDLASEPTGGYGAAWGLDPYALRPDGTDPSDIDDTFARDWLGTLTLKTATTRDGVLIATYNTNRCLDWQGPFDDGSYFCTGTIPPQPGMHPDVARGPFVYFDNYAEWSEDDWVQVLYFPLTTIGSTGLPDPLVPGGNTVLIAGTDRLADPDWDDCAWPHQFQTDTVVYEDWASSWGGTGSVWGDTYKFGKDADLDLRVALATNEARGYCEGNRVDR